MRLLEAENRADAQHIDVGDAVARVPISLPLGAEGHRRTEVEARAHAVGQVEAVFVLAESLHLRPGEAELAVHGETIRYRNRADADQVPARAFRRPARDLAEVDITRLQGNAPIDLVAAEDPDRHVVVVRPIPVRL